MTKSSSKKRKTPTTPSNTGKKTTGKKTTGKKTTGKKTTGKKTTGKNLCTGDVKKTLMALNPGQQKALQQLAVSIKKIDPKKKRSINAIARRSENAQKMFKKRKLEHTPSEFELFLRKEMEGVASKDDFKTRMGEIKKKWQKTKAFKEMEEDKKTIEKGELLQNVIPLTAYQKHMKKETAGKKLTSEQRNVINKTWIESEKKRKKEVHDIYMKKKEELNPDLKGDAKKKAIEEIRKEWKEKKPSEMTALQKSFATYSKENKKAYPKLSERKTAFFKQYYKKNPKPEEVTEMETVKEEQKEARKTRRAEYESYKAAGKKAEAKPLTPTENEAVEPVSPSTPTRASTRIKKSK
jgi:hypothetical protein